MNKSDSIVELAKALASAQAELANASKNAKNPHFRSSYADLGEILNVIRPVFAKHGLGIMQMPDYEAGVATVQTLVTHSSGEYISSQTRLPVGKQDAQGVGSAITYARRYSLAAVAGIGQEDDDGQSAVGNAQQQQPQQQYQQPQQQARPRQPSPFNFDKAVSLVSGAADVDTVNKYVHMAQQRGATDLQMQSIQAAAMERLSNLGETA